VEVISNIWNKDSNTLFDYEANDVTISKIRTDVSGDLIFHDKMLLYNKELADFSNKLGGIFLTSMLINKDNFIIKVEEREKHKINPDDKVWLIIRHTFQKPKPVK